MEFRACDYFVVYLIGFISGVVLFFLYAFSRYIKCSYISSIYTKNQMLFRNMFK